MRPLSLSLSFRTLKKYMSQRKSRERERAKGPPTQMICQKMKKKRRDEKKRETRRRKKKRDEERKTAQQKALSTNRQIDYARRL